MELALTVLLWIVCTAFLVSTGVLIALIVKYDRQQRADKKRTEDVMEKLKRLQAYEKEKDRGDTDV